MNTLTLTVHANKDGIYTAKGTIKQILDKFKNIQAPKMPCATCHTTISALYMQMQKAYQVHMTLTQMNFYSVK